MLIVVIINMTNDDYIVVENRFKSEFPVLSMASIFDRSYQDGIEDYFGDQIIAEKKFIEAKSQYEILLGNDTIRNSVLVGEDMFFSKTTLSDMNGKLLNEEQLVETVTYLEEIEAYYSELGYDFYFAIGPNKSSIYSEKIPSIDVADYRIMDQLKDEIDKSGSVQVIDLYDELINEKSVNDELLYFSYDSHWNYLGGLIAAKTILTSVYEDPMIDFDGYKNDLVYSRAENTDMANIIGVGDLYYDETYVPAEIVNFYKDFIDLSNDSEEELIVIRDSFFDNVAPVFQELNVSQKYVAFLSHYKEGYTPSKDRGSVIMLVVERNIYPSIKGAHETIFE